MHAFLLTAALLSPSSQNSTILKAIDNICGDTWCEGDYSFRFQKVILDTAQNSTRVLFTMSITSPVEVSAQGSVLKQKFDVSCTVPGYATYESIMQSPDSLNWDFYSSLTDCIQSLEKRLSKVNRAE